MQCVICEFRCDIDEDNTGICRMYENEGDTVKERYPDMYLVSAPAPIEAMPMVHYYPNSKFLQVCTIGCNFRCSGCVSWLLTENSDAIQSAIEKITSEDLIQRALDLECIGIMFCFNEPAVSFFTFKKIAKFAREKGLKIGCATNGYFTEKAFLDLLQHIDFINIGLKGFSEDVYRKNGALSHTPIYRNLELSVKNGIHTEVAAVYMKGMENEVIKIAQHLASLSKDIPFQIMRFMPLCDSDYSDEPSIRESEELCVGLKEILNHVYLFNSPGTEYLNTYCPGCGGLLIRRGFNGPMCSNIIEYSPGGKCDCGHARVYEGSLCEDNGLDPLGFFGGYKNILSLENIRIILAFLGESNSQVICRVLHDILKKNYIKGLYSKSKKVSSYFDTVEHFAKIADRGEEAKKLRAYIETKVSEVSRKVIGAERPRVYFALGHPLIAVFGDKFECNLVEIAGGYCVNKEIQREDIPGKVISVELLNSLNPEIILIHGASAYPASDFYSFCIDKCIKVSAIENSRIYNIHPYRAAGSPDWVLGLLYIANILHPELFTFDVPQIADELYNSLFGTDYAVLNHNRTFDLLLSEQIKKQISEPFKNG